MLIASVVYDWVLYVSRTHLLSLDVGGKPGHVVVQWLVTVVVPVIALILPL